MSQIVKSRISENRSGETSGKKLGKRQGENLVARLDERTEDGMDGTSNAGEYARQDTRSIELNEGQRLTIESRDGENIVCVESAGETLVTLRVNRDGAEIVLSDGCAVRSRGSMTIEADLLTLRAQEKLQLESGGDVSIRARGDLDSEARIQQIKSTLGNVSIKANDDFEAHAERILLNT